MALILALHFADQYPPAVKEEFEQIIAAIQNSLANQATLINELSSAIAVGTLAATPTGLGTGDAGFRYRVSDYGHEVVWNGSIWEFAPGDCGSGFFSVRALAPQEVGWQVCDGSATNYLTVGAATLSATAFTTPNPTDGTFLKRLAAYTGAIDAATMTGQTAAVDDAGATADDMNITSFLAGPGPTIAISNSRFIHKHGVGTLASTPKALGGLLYFRR